MCAAEGSGPCVEGSGMPCMALWHRGKVIVACVALQFKYREFQGVRVPGIMNVSSHGQEYEKSRTRGFGWEVGGLGPLAGRRLAK